MSDLKEQFDKWQREAKKSFEAIDERLGISEKIEHGAKTVAETAQKGAEHIRHEAERSEAGRRAVNAVEEGVRAAEGAAKKAWDISEPLRNAAGSALDDAAETAKNAGKAAVEMADAAENTAADVFNRTRDAVESGARRAAQALSFGAAWTRTIDSAFETARRTGEWVTSYPLRAAAAGSSLIIGAGLGVVFTGISSHWLFNSALPAWSVKKLGEQFIGYLRSQEDLIAKGSLSEAEAERVKFERDIVKLVGAPLLGAFSFASGAVMMTNVLNPKEITGAPLSWLLGGNPLLEGVWFFGNGLVCFKTGYDVFMIALDDNRDVERMMRSVKALLPA